MSNTARFGARILLFGLLFIAMPTHAVSQHGSFPHPLDLRMSSNGRDATLLSAFAYIDGNGKRWEVPAATSAVPLGCVV